MSDVVTWVGLLAVHIPWLLAADSPEAGAPALLDLNALVGGGAGAALLAIVYYAGKLILDRTIPSRSDSRANISILLEGMQSMVTVLQKERNEDAQRLANRQQRIDELELESDSSFARRAEMQAEIIELRSRVAQRDRHIRKLVSVLTQVGVSVQGLDSDTLEITLPFTSPDVQEAKKATESSD